MAVAGSAQKILLCTLNSKYIHSSLALRYLRTYTKPYLDLNIQIKEYTINQNSSDIMADIYLNRPEVLAFSCYIWNIQPILELCNDYKKIAPQTVIILGGPEVSYDAEQLLADHTYIDCVVRGEGEVTFKELLFRISNHMPLYAVSGISYREKGQVYRNPDREPIASLDEIPFVYKDEMDKMRDRIVYYETSRGCPFQCSYCLSSTTRQVRFLSMARVKSDLKFMLAHQVREIKFVDRTFNCDEKRAQEIMAFIMAHSHNKTKVHLEIDAGLFSDAMLDFLATVPPRLFNFEIGVQSTHAPALQAVRRRMDWERLSHNITRLRSFGNLHLHLDLIAGLPGETYLEFQRSFNMVYNLKPDMLQLGFLKLLKGTSLHEEHQQYGYIYQSHPPYQVLASQHIKYGEILALTYIELILDKYYNSGDMVTTIDYIGLSIFQGNAFAFYEQFSRYWLASQWAGRGHRKEALYTYLHQFIKESYPYHQEIVDELLKYDYLCRNHKYGLPPGLVSYNPSNINDLLNAYSREKSFVARNLPAAIADKAPREIRRLIYIEYFKVDPRSYQKLTSKLPLMFVYDSISKKAVKITELPKLNIEAGSK